MANKDEKPAQEPTPPAQPLTHEQRMAKLRAKVRDPEYDEYKNHLKEQFSGK